MAGGRRGDVTGNFSLSDLLVPTVEHRRGSRSAWSLAMLYKWQIGNFLGRSQGDLVLVFQIVGGLSYKGTIDDGDLP